MEGLPWKYREWEKCRHRLRSEGLLPLSVNRVSHNQKRPGYTLCQIQITWRVNDTFGAFDGTSAFDGRIVLGSLGLGLVLVYGVL